VKVIRAWWMSVLLYAAADWRLFVAVGPGSRRLTYRWRAGFHPYSRSPFPFPLLKNIFELVFVNPLLTYCHDLELISSRR